MSKHPVAPHTTRRSEEAKPTTPLDDAFVINGFDFSAGVFVATVTATVAGETFTMQERIDFRGVKTVSDPHPSLLRLLTLACSLSYYKATPSTTIEVDFALTESERLFLTSLIRNGLAEFAYRNDLPAKLSPSISASTPSSEPSRAPTPWTPSDRPIVAVGGGKDSVVTIEALKQAGHDPVLYSVNQFDPIDRCIAVSGSEYVRVDRELDPQLRILNERGASNGHVPVTAINSLIGLLIADMGCYGSVVMSNERSANYGNLDWNGLEVNHQWSKSLEFEDLLRSTLADSTLDPERYFSLLRPFREIEIAERFAQHTQYFSAFTSCNRVFTIDVGERNSTWCGECPKCHFVFLILAPFIPKPRLVEIFGHNLLNDPDNVAPFEEIVGLRGDKPFECVGEYSEAAEALQRLSRAEEWRTDAIVDALAGPSRAVAEHDGGPLKRDHRIPEAYEGARDAVARFDV